MKVSEAEKLVCPFMSVMNRVISFINIGYSHDVKINDSYHDVCNCITTKCMAWVTTERERTLNGTPVKKIEGYCQRLK